MARSHGLLRKKFRSDRKGPAQSRLAFAEATVTGEARLQEMNFAIVLLSLAGEIGARSPCSEAPKELVLGLLLLGVAGELDRPVGRATESSKPIGR